MKNIYAVRFIRVFCQSMKSLFRLNLIVLLMLTLIVSSIVSAQTNASAKNEKLFNEIVELVQLNNLSEAENKINRILSTQPNNVTALTLAGIIAERREKLAEAEKKFALAVKISPKTPETRNNYGAILVRLSRPKEAAKEFETSLKLKADQLNAIVNLAQIRFTENDLSAARLLFEKALTLAPDAEIARALIIISLKLAEKQKAKSDYARYSLIAKDVSLTAQMELGEILFQSGLFEEAQKELQAVISKNSDDVKATVLLSKIYLRNKDFKSAGKLLETAVAKGIQNGGIYAALADVYEAAGYLENAIPVMRLAIEKEPKNEFYRVRYGLLLIDSKAPAAAIIRLKESAAEFPRSDKILLVLGIAQQTDGKSDDARNSFEKVLKLEPKSVPALAYLALIMDEKGNYAETISTTELALAIEEKNAILHYLLADTILKIPSGDTKKAEHHLNRAIELDANLAQAYLSLGRLLARQNRWEEAAAKFETAVKLTPDFAEAQYQLGRALARLKRTEESNRAFEKFKILNESQTAKKESTRKELVQRLANTRF